MIRIKSNKELWIMGVSAFAAAASTVGCSHTEKALNTNRPNVVFIYADDMGRGMLSHYGQKYLSTPNIDRLFKQGTSFNWAHGCQYSAPSRASLLTGYSNMRQDDKWVISNGGLFMRDDISEVIDSVETSINAKDVVLAKEDITLPQLFKRAGYVTGEVGKLEWGFTTTRQQMERNEWDYYYGYLDHVRCHGYYPPYLFENGKIVPIDGNTLTNCGKVPEVENPENYAIRWNLEGKKTYSQNIFIEKVLGFIRENKDKPFFLYHPTQLPHGPVAIPEVHPELKNVEGLSELEKEYGSMIKMLDDHVGMILDELEKLGILDNTIIVFSADNGHETYYATGNRNCKGFDTEGQRTDMWDYPYTSERTGDLFDGNDGQLGKKWSNLQGGISVPLVFMWGDKIEANKASKQLTANYDLFTTFADMLNIKSEYKKDGVSLMPILTGGKDLLPEQRYVTVWSDFGNTVLRSDGWKLRHNRKEDVYRLFYIPDDYTESTDLLEKHPDIVKDLKTHI